MTVSPERIVINRTDSTTLHCNAGGGPDNTYQWYHDNRLLQGETQSTLSLNIVGISDGGDYNCTVTNAAGSGSSISVVLSEFALLLHKLYKFVYIFTAGTYLGCDGARMEYHSKF